MNTRKIYSLRKAIHVGAATLSMLALPASAIAEVPQFTGHQVADGVLATILYSAIGIVMAFIAYRVVDLLTPGNLGKDIADGNTALAILAGFKILGVCIIIAAAIVG